MVSRGLFPHRKMIEVFTRNSTFQQLEGLQTNRQKRHRLGLTLIEGVLMIDAARPLHAPIDAFVYDKGRSLSSWANGVLQSAGKDAKAEQQQVRRLQLGLWLVGRTI